MNDSANSNGSGQSARERLDELATSAGDDGIAQIAATLTNGLADVEKMFDKHAGRLDAAADKFGVVVGRLQDSMLLLGSEFQKLATRLAIAEARIEMLEGRFETRQ